MNGIDQLFGELGKIITPAVRAIAEAISPVMKETMQMVDDAAQRMAWDLKNESADDYQIRRWLSQVPHGGIVGEKAVLIVYNEQHPSQSYLIVEDIKI